MLNLLHYDPFRNDANHFERFGESTCSSWPGCPDKGRDIEEDEERLDFLARHCIPSSRAEAERFLRKLDPDASGFTFQTFDDNAKRKDKTLGRVLNGTLDQHWSTLCNLNRNKGAGVYITVNETDGKGRRKENVTRARALFVDLDGAPLEPVLESTPEPHIVVQSSPKRFHCYWVVKDIALERFERLQKALAGRFGGDPAVCDLPRVLRLPGFYHCKREPYRSHIFSLRHSVPSYKVADFKLPDEVKDDDDDVPKIADNFATAFRPSLEEVEAALDAIPNDEKVDRKQWVDIGHAIKSAYPDNDGLKLFKKWSKKWTGGEYNEKHTVTAWKSFEPNRTGIGKIFKLANEADRHIGEVEIEEQGQTQATEEREWPVLALEALHGLAGEVVRTIEPHTESDPAAILVQFLVAFGNVIGRGPFVQREGDKHFTNLYCVLVGESAKSRKGTSAGRVREIMSRVDEDWTDRCIQSGLSSGEGLIWAIRDQVLGINKKGETVVEVTEVKDKRLYLNESEFSQVLTVMRREGNTVSRMVRDGWDSRPLSSLTKNSKGSVKKPHISIVGHITRDELRQFLDLVSMTNGFANRFLYVCVRRSKELPHGGHLSASAVDALSKKIGKVVSPLTTLALSEGRIGVKDKEEESNVVHFERFGKEHSNGMVEVSMNAKACALWESMYHDLTNGPSGSLGAICGRAEAQVIRLALLYTLLDSKDEIEPMHLRAGMAVWKYCEDSAAYIFGTSLGSAFADELLRVLRESGGMSRTAISNAFQRNQKHENISAALNLLRDRGLAKCETRTASKGKSTGGRPVEFWVPVN